MRKLTVAALAAAAIGLTACGGTGHGAVKPSVAACAKAYPAWFAASAAAGKTTATPPGCQGLTQDQVAQIGTAYLAEQGGQ